jgi:DNA-directed RNA polymerase subunit N (RpoN/RPB10)
MKCFNSGKVGSHITRDYGPKTKERERIKKIKIGMFAGDCCKRMIKVKHSFSSFLLSLLSSSIVQASTYYYCTHLHMEGKGHKN